jgi:quercetin dioxygenase-like cupin family protein
MRYVRPFDLQGISCAATSPWIIAPEESLGFSLRIRRGGGTPTPASVCGAAERFAVVLAGEVSVASDASKQLASTNSVAFIPAGRAAAFAGDSNAYWVEVEAAAQPQATATSVGQYDPAKFEGEGFAYQLLMGRQFGAQSMRMNMMQVQPGAGSPDFHIHAFTQAYIILDGVLTIDVGRARHQAPRNSIVCLPPGVVHRNFNAANEVERHISFLAPEPQPGAIFDYAVDIHEVEAEIMKSMPA